MASQRDRMLVAMMQTVAAKGYGPTTVADVIGGAGVSRKTFYEHFADKEACFLAAYDASVELVLERIRAAAAPADGDRLTVIRRRVGAYLEALEHDPAVARVFLIEIGAAGPAALARRDRVHDAFAALFAEVVPDAPFEQRLAAVGAADTVVTRRVVLGHGAELHELTDRVTAIITALLGDG